MIEFYHYQHSFIKTYTPRSFNLKLVNTTNYYQILENIITSNSNNHKNDISFNRISISGLTFEYILNTYEASPLLWIKLQKIESETNSQHFVLNSHPHKESKKQREQVQNFFRTLFFQNITASKSLMTYKKNGFATTNNFYNFYKLLPETPPPRQSFNNFTI